MSAGTDISRITTALINAKTTMMAINSMKKMQPKQLKASKKQQKNTKKLLMRMN